MPFHANGCYQSMRFDAKPLLPDILCRVHSARTQVVVACCAQALAQKQLPPSEVATVLQRLLELRPHGLQLEGTMTASVVQQMVAAAAAAAAAGAPPPLSAADALKVTVGTGQMRCTAYCVKQLWGVDAQLHTRCLRRARGQWAGLPARRWA